MMHLFARYGDIFGVWMGTVRAVVVSNYGNSSLKETSFSLGIFDQ